MTLNPNPKVNGCCNTDDCTIRKCKNDCSNLIPFQNLINVPSDFAPGPGESWDNLKISIIPSLSCLVEPCMITDNLPFTDPCGVSHVIPNCEISLNKIRIVGGIKYMISAQYANSQQGNSSNNASVSDQYFLSVDRVIGFTYNHHVKGCCISVECNNLGFDDPLEFIYGDTHALKIKGDFTINVGTLVETFKNGNFEEELEHWDLDVPTGATAETVEIFNQFHPLVYNPIDGCKFALIKTNGPGSNVKLSQTFEVKAGDKIEGWSFFKAVDYLPFDDNCKVNIKSGEDVIETVFRANVSSVGNYGQTPWTYWSYTFTSDGTYTLEATIANSIDSILDSYIGLDAIKLCRNLN